MNKIYKVVWSKVKNCYVVVSEIAKNIITGGVKSAKVGTSPLVKGAALGAAMAFVITGNVWAANMSNQTQANEINGNTTNYVVDGAINASETNIVVSGNKDVTILTVNGGYVADYNSWGTQVGDANVGIGGDFRGTGNESVTISNVKELHVNGGTFGVSAGTDARPNAESMAIPVGKVYIDETVGSTFIESGAYGVFGGGSNTLVQIESKNVSIKGGSGGAGVITNAAGTINLGTEENKIENLTVEGKVAIYASSNASHINVLANNVNLKSSSTSVQSNGGNIHLGSEDNPLGNINIESSSNYAVLVQSSGGSVDVYGNDVSLVTNKQGGTAIYGYANAPITIVGEEALNIKGNIYTDRANAIVNINTGIEDSLVTIEGNVTTGSQGGSVDITLGAEGSYLKGKITDSNDGVTLNMNEGTTWEVTNASHVGTINAENATFVIDVNKFDAENKAFTATTNNIIGTTTLKARGLDLSGGAAKALSNSASQLQGTVDVSDGEIKYATVTVDSALHGDVELKDGKVTTTMDTNDLVIKGDVQATTFNGVSIVKNEQGSFAIGEGASITATYSGGNPAPNTNSIAIGTNATAKSYSNTDANGAIAIGSSAVANGAQSLALGGATEAGQNCVAIGYMAKSSWQSIAIGSGSNATESSVALGRNVTASGDNSIAIGGPNGTNVSGDNSVAIGDRANVTGKNSVAIGSNSNADSDNVVSVGGRTIKRKIVNVAAGTLSATSTDAVVGSQLFATNQNVATNAEAIEAMDKAYKAADSALKAEVDTALAGKVDTNTSRVLIGSGAYDGNANDSFSHSVVIGQYATSVGRNNVVVGYDNEVSDANFAVALGFQSAVDGANYGIAAGRLAKVTGESSVALGDKANASAANSVAIGSGSVADEAYTVSVGAEGKERKVVNVKAGDLTETSTDAVNGSQLYATNQRVGANAEAIAFEAGQREYYDAEEARTRDAADVRLQAQIDAIVTTGTADVSALKAKTEGIVRDAEKAETKVIDDFVVDTATGKGKVTIGYYGEDEMIFTQNNAGVFTFGVNAQTGAMQAIGGAEFGKRQDGSYNVIMNADGVAIKSGLTIGGNAQVDGVLDVNGKIATAGDVVANAAGKQVSLKETADQVALQGNKITALENASAEQSGKITALEGLTAQHSDKIGALENASAEQAGKITALEELTSEHSNKIGALEDLTAQHSDKIGALEDLTAQQGNKITALENSDIEQSNKITALENTAGEQSGKITALEGLASEHTDKITALENDSAEQSGKITALEGLTSEHTDKITALENDSAEQSGKITALENSDAAQNTAIASNTEAIKGLNQRLGKLNGKVNKVGAGAAALAALHPLEYDPDDKLTFSAGVGNYNGTNAAALGAFYRPDEKLMFSLGGTMGNGENMVNLGVSIGLDGAKGAPKLSRKELVEKVSTMEAENQAIKAENENIKAEVAELKALVAKLVAKK